MLTYGIAFDEHYDRVPVKRLHPASPQTPAPSVNRRPPSFSARQPIVSTLGQLCVLSQPW
eukprot:1948956-Rhodomonas_salina.3